MKRIKLKNCQNEALDALKQCRDKRKNRGLIVMASSLGKTYTAIFDIAAFMKTRQKRGRVLVLCHTIDILQNLKENFMDIYGDKYSYGHFSSLGRCLEKTDFLFASFQSMYNYLNTFNPKEFDYILVDECHHSKAKTYEEVIRHFKPKFLLGMTATPTRTDGKKISDIFGEPIYTVDLVDAIGNDLVAAINYRLMFDDIYECNALSRKGNIINFFSGTHSPFLLSFIPTLR